MTTRTGQKFDLYEMEPGRKSVVRMRQHWKSRIFLKNTSGGTCHVNTSSANFSPGQQKVSLPLSHLHSLATPQIKPVFWY